MRGTGQPGDALLAKPEDAGCEATRILINKLNGSMHDPISYWIAVQARQGDAVTNETGRTQAACRRWKNGRD
jgi:hypothetical protein